MQTEMEYLRGREINSLRSESVGEYSLPDYNGDVKKILAVKTKVFPSGKFVGDETLEFSGSVEYSIVYVDGDNGVTHTEFSTDYDAAVKINSETYVDSDVETSVSGCNVRLVGPRKLSVKCSLDSDVRICEKRLYEIGGDAFMGYEPQTLTASANIFEPSFAVGEPREMSDEILSIDGAIADEVEVLLSDAGFVVETLDIDGDNAILKGDIEVSALIRNAEERPRIVTKKIPYADELSLSDAETLTSLDSRVELSSFRTSVTPTEDGVSITVSLSASSKIYGKKNNSLLLVTDSFLMERGTENEYSDFGYTEHICTERREENFEVKKSLYDLGIENVGDVIYSEAQARVEKAEIVANGVEIQGELRFSGIACQVSEGGEEIYSPIRFTVPFAQNVNINCQINDNMRVNAAVDASDVKINLDENNVCASASLRTFVTVNSERRQRCLGASYLTDEEYMKDDSVVTVYYPDSSESLFTIAKRFHTSVGEIAEANRLTESVFASSDAPIGNEGIKKLLIK